MIPVTPEIAAQLAARKAEIEASRGQRPAARAEAELCALCGRPAEWTSLVKDPATGLSRRVRFASPFCVLPIGRRRAHVACVENVAKRRAA